MIIPRLSPNLTSRSALAQCPVKKSKAPDRWGRQALGCHLSHYFSSRTTLKQRDQNYPTCPLLHPPRPYSSICVFQGQTAAATVSSVGIVPHGCLDACIISVSCCPVLRSKPEDPDEDPATIPRRNRDHCLCGIARDHLYASPQGQRLEPLLPDHVVNFPCTLPHLS